MSQPEAGWYRDPSDPERLRLWNGSQWSQQTKLPGEQASENQGLQGVEKHLSSAAKWAQSGEIEKEHQELVAALKLASSSGGGLRKLTGERIRELVGQGTVITGSKLIAIVEPYLVITGEDAERRSPYWHKSGIGGKGLMKPFSDFQGPPIEIRSDRIIQGEKAYRIDEHTRAQVFLDGDKQVTYRPTATRALLLAPLPGGVAGPALATQKRETHDTRQASFQVGSVDWSCKTKIEPRNVNDARPVAERINRIADSLQGERSGDGTSREASNGSIADEISKLRDLQASGVLTDEEFAAAKKKLLG